jgi:hypothetical protein
MDEARKCKNCGKLIQRKRQNGKLESLRDLSRRNFCNRRCSTLFQQANIKGNIDPEKEAVREAVKTAELSKSGEELRPALDILAEAANNIALDWTTRINAAKALAPFQAARVGEGKPGKKDARQDAAKQAATGKFGARPAPSNVIPLRKEG